MVIGSDDGGCWPGRHKKTIFFSANPHVELLKLAGHKKPWILQAIKRFGYYYYRKYNNREIVQLIREIIERS